MSKLFIPFSISNRNVIIGYYSNQTPPIIADQLFACLHWNFCPFIFSDELQLFQVEGLLAITLPLTISSPCLLCVLDRFHAEMSTGAQGQVSLQTAWCCYWESWCIALFSRCRWLWLGSLVHWLKNTPKALGSNLMFDSVFLELKASLFLRQWIHHCSQTIQFLFNLTIKQKTRSLLRCPDEHLQRPSRLLCALSGEVASFLVCVWETQQRTVSVGLWHQQSPDSPGWPWWWSLDSFSPLSLIFFFHNDASCASSHYLLREACHFRSKKTNKQKTCWLNKSNFKSKFACGMNNFDCMCVEGKYLERAL